MMSSSRRQGRLTPHRTHRCARLLGTHLRTLREAAGLTQVDLSLRTGLSQGYISELEHGKSTDGLPVRMLITLALSLGVTLAGLLGVLDDALGLALPVASGQAPRAPTQEERFCAAQARQLAQAQAALAGVVPAPVLAASSVDCCPDIYAGVLPTASCPASRPH